VVGDALGLGLLLGRREQRKVNPVQVERERGIDVPVRPRRAERAPRTPPAPCSS